jgi:hypothetical protein
MLWRLSCILYLIWGLLLGFQLTGSQARNGAAATGEKTTVYHVFDTMEGLTQRHGTDAW